MLTISNIKVHKEDKLVTVSVEPWRWCADERCVASVMQSVGLPEIENLFFSRRYFSQPDRQIGPHKDFHDEVKVLDQHCGKYLSLFRVVMIADLQAPLRSRGYAVESREDGAGRIGMVIANLPSLQADGSAFVLGKLNGEHWYLYMTERPEKKYAPFR